MDHENKIIIILNLQLFIIYNHKNTYETRNTTFFSINLLLLKSQSSKVINILCRTLYYLLHASFKLTKLGCIWKCHWGLKIHLTMTPVQPTYFLNICFQCIQGKHDTTTPYCIFTVLQFIYRTNRYEID